MTLIFFQKGGVATVTRPLNFGGLNANSSKMVKVQTSNLTHVFSGTIRTWPPEFFFKKRAWSGSGTFKFGGSMPIAPKPLKIRTSNLTCACYQGQRRHVPEFFLKKGAWPCHVTPNFWSLNANTSKTVKATDFKFGTQFPGQYKYFFSKRGRGKFT